MEIYTANQYIRDTYGEKLYKLSLDAGTTCPNRDGTVGWGGCIFCSNRGSGDFVSCPEKDIDTQIDAAKERIAAKCKCDRYIAYFQSFTNTYGDLEALKACFLKAAARKDIAVLSIATRPDCVDDAVIEMLREIRKQKPVWVELGLQTIREDTAERINRCYPLSAYDEAVKKLKKLDVHIIVHMILGLPGESKENMTATARYIGESGVHGIKLQLLHVLQDTKLAELYQKHCFETLSLEEYTDILVACLKVLPKEMVIHRLTGDGPRNLLVSPLWSRDKKRVLNTLYAAIRNA